MKPHVESNREQEQERSKLLRMLEFLVQLGTLRTKLVRDIGGYERVFWISSIPQERGCFTQAWGREEDVGSDVWIEIQTQREPSVPDVPSQCEGWIDRESLRNKADIPELLSEITVQSESPVWREGGGESEHISQTITLDDCPEIQRTWDRYLEDRWLPWLEEHNQWESVHSVYSELFAIHQEQNRRGEEFELVLGLGLLTWETPNGQRVCRHLIVGNALLDFEAELGRFTVRPAPAGSDVRPELDMLEIGERPASAEETAKTSLLDANDDPWEKPCIGEVLKALAHSINAQGEYDDALAKKGIQASAKPVIELAPALILRKRSSKGYIEALHKIRSSIEQGGNFPPEFGKLGGVKSQSGHEPINGCESPVDFSGQQIYFPKPSNEEQRRIVDNIRSASGVLVQGPPGTGKSHTIANLICHLLATGQRILITAKTPRALQVLKQLVPEELQPLCINLLGSGHEERQSLESSVGGILHKNEQWKEDRNKRECEEHEESLQRLREEKATVDRRLRDIREAEIHSQSIAEGTYRGTAARIAEAVNRDRCKYEWFTDRVPLDSSCPVRKEDLLKAVDVLRRSTPDRRRELQQVWPAPDAIVAPDEFTVLVRRERKAKEVEEAVAKSFPWLRIFRIGKARKHKQECEEELLQVEDSTSEKAVSSNAHPESQLLFQAVRNRDIDAYRIAFDKITDLHSERRWLNGVEEWLKRIGKVLPDLTDELRRAPEAPYWESYSEQIRDAYHWGQARYWIVEYIRKEDAPALAIRSKQIEDEINGTLANLASLRAWSFCFSRLTDTHRSHMEAWQQSMRKLGKGTGKHAPRHRRDAQEHLNKCHDAVPAWIMPLHRVWDTIDPIAGMFDLVIIDEASQCGIEALPLFFLGKKVLIVGDDKQISPDAVGLPRDDVHRLMEEYLHDFDLKSTFDVENSLFDHGKLQFGTRRITLREHFRCMLEIIRFSNDLCYSDTPLIPMRQSQPDRLPPIEHVFVRNGHREGRSSRVVNSPEAEAIVEKIVAMCGDDRYREKTIGVVVLQGEAQGGLIENKLLEQLGAEEIGKRRLICGNPYSFQGDERDVMILSMVAAPNERIGPFTKPADERRFNVAASRARDQMILFHSVSSNDLSGTCLRRRLLEFFENTRPQEIAGISRDELERRASQDNRSIVKPPEPFDSWFEVDVALALLREHFVVLPQYEVAGKRIDLVIEGGRSRLAVECDGDEYHGADRYEEDMQRQRQLERCGWEFFRVRESSFCSNRENALVPLWRMLEERDIFPRGLARHESDGAIEPYDEERNDKSGPYGTERGNAPRKNRESVAKHIAPTQTVSPAESVSVQDISEAIIRVLTMCPNNSCTLKSLPSSVLKELGIRTRGKPFARLKTRVLRMASSLDDKGSIEKYKAKNERVRLVDSVPPQKNLW